VSKETPEELLNHLNELSYPHFEAIHDAVVAAYPERDDVYVAAIALNFCTMLNAIDPARRPDVIQWITLDFLPRSALS